MFLAFCCRQRAFNDFGGVVFGLYSHNRFDRVASPFQLWDRISFLQVLVIFFSFLFFFFFFFLTKFVPCICVRVLLFPLISLWYLICHKSLLVVLLWAIVGIHTYNGPECMYTFYFLLSSASKQIHLNCYPYFICSLSHHRTSTAQGLFLKCVRQNPKIPSAPSAPPKGGASEARKQTTNTFNTFNSSPRFNYACWQCFQLMRYCYRGKLKFIYLTQTKRLNKKKRWELCENILAVLNES